MVPAQVQVFSLQQQVGDGRSRNRILIAKCHHIDERRAAATQQKWEPYNEQKYKESECRPHENMKT